MILREDLQELARVRMREAEALFSAGLYDGSVYLCGYVMEMALKACVCKTLGLSEYPDAEQKIRQAFRTHDFEVLEVLAGLRPHVAARKLISATFAGNWELATRWTTDVRYRRITTRTQAEGMLEALRSDPEGVLTWLSQQW